MPPPFPRAARAAAIITALLHAGAAAAQWLTACTSDGEPAPAAIVERFMSADCAACWSRPAQVPAAGELALDWIVPSPRGDEAPLSAAATRDSTERLASLGLKAPAATSTRRAAVAMRAPQGPQPVQQQALPGLRVARGVPVGGYLGTAMRYLPPAGRQPPRPGAPLTAWLLLVETLPTGTEGSPVERNLVRNALAAPWSGPALQLDGDGPLGYQERRSMSIPAGARPERLRLVGLLQDARGRIQAAAVSRCAPPATQ
ncbi:hypothetical protein PY257_01495 [Ramlibacter sp. H39-3-26]|uniref:hypothetical protein n=1 Tax=Curvibacter soli TaxID=3031331 RepID=UPI0023D9A6D6|nr:hypothetical protein [Ramlibacter sp. H39-3-26]MDF1483873.1 hypothetical protein [Ramlibacter sp. H39-3-26]